MRLTREFAEAHGAPSPTDIAAAPADKVNFGPGVTDRRCYAHLGRRGQQSLTIATRNQLLSRVATKIYRQGESKKIERINLRNKRRVANTRIILKRMDFIHN